MHSHQPSTMSLVPLLRKLRRQSIKFTLCLVFLIIFIITYLQVPNSSNYNTSQGPFVQNGGHKLKFNRDVNLIPSVPVSEWNLGMEHEGLQQNGNRNLLEANFVKRQQSVAVKEVLSHTELDHHEEELEHDRDFDFENVDENGDNVVTLGEDRVEESKAICFSVNIVQL